MINRSLSAADGSQKKRTIEGPAVIRGPLFDLAVPYVISSPQVGSQSQICIKYRVGEEGPLTLCRVLLLRNWAPRSEAIAV